MSFLSGLLGGIGNLFSKGASAIGEGVKDVGQFVTGGNYGQGQMFGTGGNAGFNLPNALGRGLDAFSSMFGKSGGNNANQMNAMTQNAQSQVSGILPGAKYNYLTGQSIGNGGGGNGSSSGSSSLWNSIWNGSAKNMAGSEKQMQSGFPGLKSMLPGLGMIGASQMIGNAKMPGMPAQFTDYMSQLRSGGTPGMQAAQKFNMDVLSGANPELYNAATQSIDLAYQEQKRQLDATYKSLRPGTDITTDSTYQRDLSNLNKQYDQQRAMALAQVQQGAAGALNQQGTQLLNMQGAGVQNYVDQIATQWDLNQAQKQALRETIMGLGSKAAGVPMDIGSMLAQGEMFRNMFGK